METIETLVPSEEIKDLKEKKINAILRLYGNGKIDENDHKYIECEFFYDFLMNSRTIEQALKNLDNQLDVNNLEKHIGGRFQIFEKIYEGNNSVYKCLDTKENNNILIIKKHNINSEKGRLLVEQEIKVLQHLNTAESDYIIWFCSHFMVNDIYYTITEYLPEYINIENLIKRRTLLSSFEKHPDSKIKYLKGYSRVFYNLIAGLKIIHSMGVVHRDIKSQNILINERTLQIKYIDFGLSVMGEDIENEINQKVPGTPYYIDPKIMKNFLLRKIDFNDMVKSDIYALGVLLYRMITGTFLVNDYVLSIGDSWKSQNGDTDGKKRFNYYIENFKYEEEFFPQIEAVRQIFENMNSYSNLNIDLYNFLATNINRRTLG